MPKIREVNEHLSGRHQPTLLVREMHPELCFWALNQGQPLRRNKKTQAGYDERVALLSRFVAGAVDLVDRVLRETRRSAVRRDDVVDALVGAVVARLGRADLKTLPEAPEQDSAGLPLRFAQLSKGICSGRYSKIDGVGLYRRPAMPDVEAMNSRLSRCTQRGWRNGRPEALQYLPMVRQLVREGRHKEAQEMARRRDESRRVP